MLLWCLTVPATAQDVSELGTSLFVLIQHKFREANLYSFVQESKGLLFYKSHRCLWICLKTFARTSAPRAYPTYCSTTVLYFVVYAGLALEADLWEPVTCSTKGRWFGD